MHTSFNFPFTILAIHGELYTRCPQHCARNLHLSNLYGFYMPLIPVILFNVQAKTEMHFEFYHKNETIFLQVWGGLLGTSNSMNIHWK